jgi:hypothetical protein
MSIRQPAVVVGYNALLFKAEHIAQPFDRARWIAISNEWQKFRSKGFIAVLH